MTFKRSIAVLEEEIESLSIRISRAKSGHDVTRFIPEWEQQLKEHERAIEFLKAIIHIDTK